MFTKTFSFIIFAITLLWSGCGTSDRSSFPSSDNSYVTTQKPTSLSVSGQKSPVGTDTTTDTNDTSGQHSVTIQSTIHMQPGENLPLYLSVTYPDGHTQTLQSDVTFSSEDPSVASIDSNGVITAHKEGKTRIFARYHDLTAVMQIEVTADAKPLPTALQIVNYQTGAETGQQITLHAILDYDDNRSQDMDGNVTWQSETPEVCSVTESGIVTAENAGACLIVARYRNFEANTTLQITRPPEKVTYDCPATLQSEGDFQDLFVTQNYPDNNYSNQLIFDNLTVSQIETLFNKARASDPTVNAQMVLPPQEVWNGYSASEKTLYLVNAERCARGIRPLEGIDDTLERNVTKPYATYIAAHENAFLSHPHSADGKSPGDRMAEAGIALGTTAEYWGENVSMIGISLANSAQPIFESAAKSVYAWLYMDKSEAYGHRETILHTGFDDDSGERAKEGLMAAWTSQTESQDAQGIYWTKAFTVMDLFDPTAQWDDDLNHVHSVPLYRSIKQ